MGRKLSIKQVAELYGLSPRTIRRYIAEGRLHAVRVGPRVIRLDDNEVNRQLDGDSIADDGDIA